MPRVPVAKNPEDRRRKGAFERFVEGLVEKAGTELGEVGPAGSAERVGRVVGEWTLDPYMRFAGLFDRAMRGEEINPLEVTEAVTEVGMMSTVVGRAPAGSLGSMVGKKGAKRAASKTDTPEFRKWFGESKVVDEAGEPLTVYHGTPHGSFAERAGKMNKQRGEAIKEYEKLRGEYIEVSDAIRKLAREEMDKTGVYPRYNETLNLWRKEALELAGRSQDAKAKIPTPQPEGDVFRFKGTNDPGYLGSGFYFTGDKKYARQWAESPNRGTMPGEKLSPHIYETHLSIKNPYVPGTEIKNKKLYDKAHAVATTEAKKLTDDAVEIWSQAHTEGLKAAGYDGIIGKSAAGDGVEYIVFSPTQIKSTKNRGTFDPNDPNILRGQVSPGVPKTDKDEKKKVHKFKKSFL